VSNSGDGDYRAQLARLDVLMRSLYGRTFEEFLDHLQREQQNQRQEAFALGHKLGWRGGHRVAKLGLKQVKELEKKPPKRRGPESVVPAGWADLLASDITTVRAQGSNETVEKLARKFVRRMLRGDGCLVRTGSPPHYANKAALPGETVLRRLIRAYYRRVVLIPRAQPDDDDL
jgi:hypothetical protein